VHYEEIFKLPACSNERASSLRYLYDKVMVHTRGLSLSVVDEQQYGSILILVLMSRLPTDVRIRVAREQERELWDIKELLKVIQLEVSEGAHFNMSSKPHNPTRNSHQDSSASALVAQHQSVKCVLYGEPLFCFLPHSEGHQGMKGNIDAFRAMLQLSQTKPPSTRL